jgi:capsular polysaccharide biosynthesis protein
MDILKSNFIDHLTDNFLDIKDTAQLPFRKLYIGRYGYRNMLNNAEVEQYFVSQGFEVIHPDLFTLKEKVKIFREAAIIVGPGSSGFTNIIFCKQGTKALVFTNFQRISDCGINTLAEYFGIDLLVVIGYDKNDSIHSSYFVPLDKIKSAYQELLS